MAENRHQHFTLSKSLKKGDNNSKRLLCNNILVYGNCSYGDKCSYAHSLNEQKKDNVRERAYELISDCLNGVDYIVDNDIYDDDELMKTLASLCKVCANCVENKCTGGYNCKFGACDQKFRVCGDDLDDTCDNTNCKDVHLSKIGLSLLNDSDGGGILYDSDDSYTKNCNYLNCESSDESDSSNSSCG